MPAAEATEVLDGMHEVVQASSRERATERQSNLRTVLQRQAAELRATFLHGPAHGLASKLAEHERELMKNAEKLQRLENRQLHEQTEQLNPGPSTFVILGTCKNEKKRAEKQLRRIKAFEGSSFYSASEFLTLVIHETVMNWQQLVWIALDGPTFERLLKPELTSIPDADAPEESWKQLSTLLATRILGGFIASGQWVSLATTQDRIPAPILRIQPAYVFGHQLYLSAKFPDRLKSFIEHIDKGLRAGPLQGRVQWLLREKKTYLPRGRIIGQTFYLLVCRSHGRVFHTPPQSYNGAWHARRHVGGFGDPPHGYKTPWSVSKMIIHYCSFSLTLL